MATLATPSTRISTWPITVGAEGIAAAQFARCGFDVLIQANRDKSWYDLVVTRTGSLLKITVKASDDGEWRLTSGYSRNDQFNASMPFDFRNAIERWLASHGSRTVCCLVQFRGVEIDELPRIYLALPGEVAQTMRETAVRTGRCALKETYEWTHADGSKIVEDLPSCWRFSPKRIEDLLAQHASQTTNMEMARGAAQGVLARELLLH